MIYVQHDLGADGLVLGVLSHADQTVDALERLAILEDLYSAHRRGALGLACRILRNQQDAEEAVQEVFLSVWRKTTLFDVTRGSTRTWVLSAVRNRAIDMIRARQRRPVYCPETDVQDAECDVAASALTSVDREWIVGALAGLPAAQRTALELAYFGGFSHTEIADQLDLPVGTVKSRLRLALDHLRVSMATETFVAAA